jgi:hypothetical protein
MLHAVPDGLLYAGTVVWVVRKGFLNPPGKLRVGFVFILETPPFESRGGSQRNSGLSGKILSEENL